MYLFEKVTIDLINYSPYVSTGYYLVCTIVNCFSKYIYFVPYGKTISGEGFSQLFLHTILARHGMPHRIISDRDSRFTL